MCDDVWVIVDVLVYVVESVEEGGVGIGVVVVGDVVVGEDECYGVGVVGDGSFGDG